MDNLPDIIDHQQLYRQHTLCTTAVYITNQHAGRYAIRWFNPSAMIQRCGHGTLAAAAFLNQASPAPVYHFHSDKERLSVTRPHADTYQLELPIADLVQSNQKLPFASQDCYQTPADDGYMLVLVKDSLAVKNFVLSDKIKTLLNKRSLIVTALSDSKTYDIVFRYFAPFYGQDEDRATGSAASVLWPFWRERLETSALNCYQASATGGLLTIVYKHHKLLVGGRVRRTEDRERRAEEQ